jgi:hypothetical protein
LLAAVYDANQTNYHTGAYISASMLAGRACRRKVQWERFTPYYETIKRLWWPFRGTVIHALLEKRQETLLQYGWLQELKLSTQLTFPERPAPIFDTKTGAFTGRYDNAQPLRVTINGTTDLYNPLMLVVGDMKSMACEKADHFMQGELESSWERQLNTYRWLIARTRIPDAVRTMWDAAGLPPLPPKYFPAPEQLYIQGISMLELPQSGAAYHRRKDPTLYQIPEIPVWSLEDTSRWVRSVALAWYDALVLRLPQPVLPHSEAWQCKNCCFNGELIAGERCHPTAERRGGLTPLTRARGHKVTTQRVSSTTFSLE